MNSQLHSKNKKSAFNLSITQQVNQTIADPTSLQKLREKSHQKKESWRTFGSPIESQLEETNKSIYNDFDLYQSLLSDFLKEHESAANA